MAVAILLCTSPLAYPADDVFDKAIRCDNLDSCMHVMLQAADPRKPEAINVAAARMGELPKPPRGNRAEARALNAKGLAEYKKRNATTAAALLQRARTEDPGDVEVLTNLGMALLQGKRISEAELALKSALAINPRRTSTWIPLADCWFEAGNAQAATSSLLLAYEFSENKDKTRTYFESKSGGSEPKSTIYKVALGKLELQRQLSEARIVDVASIEKRGWITKTEARALMLQVGGADRKFNDDPFAREIAICYLDGALDDAFKDRTNLDLATFKRRLEPVFENMNAALDKKDPETGLKLLKCAVNSAGLMQAIKEQSSSEQKSTAPILDLDDLRVDINSLDGRKVRVSGIGHYMLEIFMLKKNADDLSPIYVDVSKLPREQRRQILQQCGDLISGCRLTIRGTVGKVSFKKGIIAESIEW